MFVLFDFGFELFKIAIQAAVYSSVILILKFALTYILESDLLKRIKFKDLNVSLSALLLVFSFTYYGDHGLGEDAYIPLGHWKTMNSTDGYAYFYLKSEDQISVDSFLVRNDHLYFASDSAYYDYRLASDKWDKYNNTLEYETYASRHQLPRINEFKTFNKQYDAYWNGWRVWLLP